MVVARWGGVFKLNVIDENVIEFNDTKWDPWERLLTTNERDAERAPPLLPPGLCVKVREIQFNVQKCCCLPTRWPKYAK